MDAFDKQIANRNFLSPLGFKFSLVRAPKVDFFSKSSNIPGLNLGAAIQPTYLKDIPIPGDKLVFDDFRLSFNVDENLENYNIIQNWMRGLGYPESVYEYTEWKQSDPNNPNQDPNTSDGTLVIFNSNYQPSTLIKFQGLFPTSLSEIEFDASQTDVQYATASVTFKYVLYKIFNYEPG
tara:strand:- start:355 stop:891 length:537 start_codon:yes stop_codon:yes gene_type:complete